MKRGPRRASGIGKRWKQDRTDLRTLVLLLITAAAAPPPFRKRHVQSHDTLYKTFGTSFTLPELARPARGFYAAEELASSLQISWMIFCLSSYSRSSVSVAPPKVRDSKTSVCFLSN